MADQIFIVSFRLETDCEETVTEEDVRNWAMEHFKGCDMGEVTAVKADELGDAVKGDALFGL